MRPAYSMAWFFAKLIRSHPSSKGTADMRMLPLRPNLSINHPPIHDPIMAPTVTKDWKNKWEAERDWKSDWHFSSLHEWKNGFRQETITRSEQLPCTRVTAFSRTSLFLEKYWREFRRSFKSHKPVSKPYRPKTDNFCLLMTLRFPSW